MDSDTHQPGPTLRRLRLLLRIKQADLAERLGVTQATVSRWERGALAMTVDQQAAAWRLLACRPDPAQDAALRRLVESSMAKVHLICDRTHRLLAASPARHAEWRVTASEMIGCSLLRYASPDILAAEASLAARGWHDGHISQFVVDTGPNSDPVIPIQPSRVLWERLTLADGSAGRLVTTLD
ncbi:helix-turn-helix transcriptional regulator [Bradyrhizobium sp. 2TAF24]|uniref:helix-turn-helix transcriptional regulator n=1 Tax=Bradyrhizobium sp. 2TAF24 TaxID=3233011 RepID=UPI003F9320C8